MVIDALTWEVMNATADDWESLEIIQRMIGPDVPGVTEAEVLSAVTRLLAAGLFEQHSDTGLPADGWFRMTTAGRELWLQHASRFVTDA